MRYAFAAPILCVFVIGTACQGAEPSDLFGDGGSSGGTSGGSSSGTTTAGTTTGTTTGTSVGTTTVGTTAGSTTAGNPVTCSAGGPPCPTGTVCRATSCGSGTCVTPPGGADDLGAVCGCDGLTYWNAQLAGTKGVAVRGSGACATGANATIKCGGLNSATCPAGAACNLQAANAGACITAVQGICWVLPPNCSQGDGLGPKRRRCAASPTAPCTAQCTLIEAGFSYYEDANCK